MLRRHSANSSLTNSAKESRVDNVANSQLLTLPDGPWMDVRLLQKHVGYTLSPKSSSAGLTSASNDQSASLAELTRIHSNDATCHNPTLEVDRFARHQCPPLENAAIALQQGHVAMAMRRPSAPLAAWIDSSAERR